jgi:hypothetical protein
MRGDAGTHCARTQHRNTTNSSHEESLTIIADKGSRLGFYGVTGAPHAVKIYVFTLANTLTDAFVAHALVRAAFTIV